MCEGSFKWFNFFFFFFWCGNRGEGLTSKRSRSGRSNAVITGHFAQVARLKKKNQSLCAANPTNFIKSQNIKICFNPAVNTFNFDSRKMNDNRNKINAQNSKRRRSLVKPDKRDVCRDKRFRKRFSSLVKVSRNILMPN